METVVQSCIDLCERFGRTPYFYITGGDPILHPDFWRLASLLRDRHLTFGILGNPFHLDDAVCERLHAHGCRKYQLSLDGLRGTHDSFRKAGSFDTTIEKIDCIKRAGMYCAIMSTVSSANVREFPQLIDLVAERGVDVFAFGRYCPTSGQKSEEFHIPPLEYRAFLDSCYKKFSQLKADGCKTTFQYKDHLWTLYLYEEGLFSVPQGNDPNMVYDGCHCGIGHMTILPNGDVYACRRMESKVGNVFEGTMFDTFNGANMDEYRRFERFEKCSKCELRGYCRGCPAVAYGYSGSMYAPDPQCWKVVS
jgi:radical SAM/SPASM domain protein of ACGX system